MKKRLSPRLSLLPLVAASACVGNASEPLGVASSAVTVSSPVAISSLRLDTASSLVAPVVADLPSGSLVFRLPRVGITALGEAVVLARDAAGAYVPGSLRGVPATLGFVLGEGMLSAAGHRTGAVVAGVDVNRRVLVAAVDATGASRSRTPTVVYTPAAGSSVSVTGLACATTACAVVFPTETGTLSFARISGEGSLLDATPRALGPTQGTFTRESVVAVGDRFVVAWPTFVTGGLADLRIARIAADGTVLDPGGRALTVAGGARSNVALATDGTRLFAVWFALASGSRPTGWYTQVFDGDLNPVSSLAVHTDLPAGPWHPAWDGTGWVITEGHVTVRFATDGARLDATPNTIVGPGTQYWAGTAPGGFRLYTPTPFAITRFTSAGAAARTDTLPTAWESADGPLRVDSDGTRLYAGYVTRGVTGIAVSPMGSALGELRLAAPCSYGCTAGIEGSAMHAFGTDDPSNPLDHRAGDWSTGALTMVPALAAPMARPSDVVRGPSQRLLLAGGRAFRLDESWRALDPAPIAFGSAIETAGSFDGTNYRMVFRATVMGPMLTARINRDGDVLDAAPRSLAELGVPWSFPQVASGGGTTMVAWSDASRAVKVVRLAADGAPGTPVTVGTMAPTMVPTEQYLPHDLALTWNGTNFVAVWIDPSGPAVRAVRLSSAGAVLDTTPWNLFPGVLTTPWVAQTREVRASSDGRGTTMIALTGFDADQATARVYASFLREDGVTAPDAGASDAAVTDAGTSDVTVVVDAGVRDATTSDVATSDVATSDVSITDAGVRDATTSDASTRDVTTSDASTSDVATSDVAITDASTSDVSTSDVSITDAGTRDVTSTADAAIADASTADVSTVDASTPPPADTGSCSVSPARSSRAAWMPLAALALLARPARRRRARR